MNKKKFVNFCKKYLTKIVVLLHHSYMKIDCNKNNEITIDTLSKIAIQFHIFFIDLLPEIYSYLNNCNVSFDLYISTDTEEKKEEIAKYFNQNKINNCNLLIIEVVENRGRDIYPFLKQLSPVYNKYDIICHMHSKKSTTVDWGDDWRRFLYDNLLGKDYFFKNLIFKFATDKKIGFVTSIPYWRVILSYLNNLMNVNNKKNVYKLLDLLNITKHKLNINTKYSCGNMFVAKTNAIHQIFDYGFTEKDFPNEEGQLENTLQHTVEFIWKYLVEYNGYKYLEVVNKNKK